MISMFVVCSFQGVLLPWALGMYDFSILPRCAAATLTFMLSASSPLYSALDCALSITLRIAFAAFFGYLPGPTFGFGFRNILNRVYGTGVFRSMTPWRYFFASSTFLPTSILQTSRQCLGETPISTPRALEVVSGSVF